THPDGDEIIGGEANGPVVPHVLGGARFDGHMGMIGDVKNGVGAKSGSAGGVVREDVGEEIGNVGRKDSLDFRV
ncbi:hypothetical protein GTO10_03000, partial [Candidatus Saccharibacteria bacterium]|nr:hypothetical protein [Candidatus Saccharibacteria bacterium]